MRASSDFEEAFPSLVLLARRAAQRVLGDFTEAEDVAAETMARAFDRWSRVQRYPEPWVVRVATNLALDQARRGSAPVLPGRSAISVEDQVIDRSTAVELLARLPRRQAEVVALTLLSDLTMARTAEVLGISLGSVKRHSKRGLASLRAAHAASRTTDPTEQAWTPTI
jgi:RNA polymerase sigma factor (sigma-70 family)